MSKNLLEIKDLSVHFSGENSVVKAVDHINFSIKHGETLGIVGESGSGKSVSALAIMQLLQMPPAKIVSGEIIYKGENLLNKSKKEIQDIRGNEIAMIFQEPMTALNPLMKIGDQIMETIERHEKVTKKESRAKALEMLEKVEIPNAKERIDSYPHQLSGGMRQRVMIAIALSCNPELLICDEPTTALDVTTQAQILDLINKLKEDFNTSVIMITHDLGVVSKVSDNVLVMYGGKSLEFGKVDDIFNNPQHPYTKSLLAAIPDVNNREERIRSIEKAVKNNDLSLALGNVEFDRNDYEEKEKIYDSEMVLLNEGHYIRKWKTDQQTQGKVEWVI